MFDKNEIAATLRRDRSSCIIGEVHILMLKGQLISKGPFGMGAHYLQLKLLSGKNARTWDSMDFT